MRIVSDEVGLNVFGIILKMLYPFEIYIFLRKIYSEAKLSQLSFHEDKFSVSGA